jgi:hypothetical protein
MTTLNALDTTEGAPLGGIGLLSGEDRVEHAFALVVPALAWHQL